MLTRFTVVFFLLLSLLLPSCTNDQHSSAPDDGYFPPSEKNGGWRKTSDAAFIRSLGVDPDKLAALGEFGLSLPSAEPEAVLVIKNGWLIGEFFGGPRARTAKAYIASIGKSFAMVSFGIAVKDSQEGLLPYHIDLNSLVYDER